MPKFHSLRVSEVRPETNDTVSVAFEVPHELQDEYRFVQGQNLTLRTDIDGEDVRRSYSICSGVDDGELRVAIKKVEGGKFSTFANEKLQPGDELQVMTPSGKFYTELDPKNEKHYVAFAAGSGITPIMSIIKTTLAKEPNSEFTLVYNNRNTKSIIFREQLEDLKDENLGRLRIFHVLSREPSQVKLYHGRIDEEKCNHICSTVLDLDTVDEVFLCGPEPMIKTVAASLEDKGLDKKKIHFELFTSPLANLGERKRRKETKPEYKGKVSKAEIILNGVTYNFDVPFDGESILDIAHENGADLPFSCKGGVCCTCRAKLEKGEVDMDVNYALEPEEVERGFILTCQSHPITEEITVNFDEQ
ncbi:1,2-phenylacetyl-CoA epoxidase subunit PaaE [Halocola ammonii]